MDARLFRVRFGDGAERGPFDVAQIEELIGAGALNADAEMRELDTGRPYRIIDLPVFAAALARRKEYERDLFDLAAARTGDLIAIGRNKLEPVLGSAPEAPRHVTEAPRGRSERLLARTGLELLTLAERLSPAHAPSGPIDWVAWAAKEMERASFRSTRQLFGSVDPGMSNPPAPLATGDIHAGVGARVAGMPVRRAPPPELTGEADLDQLGKKNKIS